MLKKKRRNIGVAIDASPTKRPVIICMHVCASIDEDRYNIRMTVLRC